jgi:hypothetical protein
MSEQLDAMLAEANRAASVNEVPRWGVGAPAAQPPNGHTQLDDDPDAFCGADLHGIASTSCERFPMPGGKHLWVFPCSGEVAHALTLRSGGLELRIDPGDDLIARDAKVRAASIELQAHQVQLVCYRDRAGKRLCFGAGQVPAIMAELSHTTIAAICELSNRLATGPTKEELAPFFNRAHDCLRNWHGASERWDDSPAGLRDETTALLSQWPEWS